MFRCGVLIQQSDARVNEDKQRYNEQQRTQYRYLQYTSDQLFRSLGVDWRGCAAACPPVARDHVTIPGLRDGRVSKLRKMMANSSICSVGMSSDEPRYNLNYRHQNMLP